ncbi:MAG: 16S rRNA (cytidine(1402)-2'-O)-methyltransferase [Aestuariivirga sp.]
MSKSYTIGAASFAADALAPGLYLVATPIGNLGDITIRGLQTLAAADQVLCEDTRTTAKLFARYALKRPLAPYHEHNAAKARPEILKRLEAGAAVALVSDAGTPLVSDPGYKLVREAIAKDIAVTSIPGPSAVITGLILSGFPSDRFLFLGFLPQKLGERTKLLAEFAATQATLIAFESPHRIAAALKDIAEILPGRDVAVTRELTKLHEEVLRGNPVHIGEQLSARPAIKGEITLLIAPPDETRPTVAAGDLKAEIEAALKIHSPSKAATEIAKRHGLGKSEVYGMILAMKDGA